MDCYDDGDDNKGASVANEEAAIVMIALLGMVLTTTIMMQVISTMAMMDVPMGEGIFVMITKILVVMGMLISTSVRLSVK